MQCEAAALTEIMLINYTLLGLFDQTTFRTYGNCRRKSVVLWETQQSGTTNPAVCTGLLSKAKQQLQLVFSCLCTTQVRGTLTGDWTSSSGFSRSFLWSFSHHVRVFSAEFLLLLQEEEGFLFCCQQK